MGRAPACQLDNHLWRSPLEPYHTLREIQCSVGEAASAGWSPGPSQWSCDFSSENDLKILGLSAGGKQNKESSAGLHLTKDFHETKLLLLCTV